MKVLVATKKTQGWRENDFFWANEGEPVAFVFECDDEGPDGSCGCKRCMAGVISHKPTTTMEVVEKDITQAQLIETLKEHYKATHWAETDEDALALAQEDWDHLTGIVLTFDVGDVIEKRGDSFENRI